MTDNPNQPVENFEIGLTTDTATFLRNFKDALEEARDAAKKNVGDITALYDAAFKMIADQAQTTGAKFSVVCEEMANAFEMSDGELAQLTQLLNAATAVASKLAPAVADAGAAPKTLSDNTKVAIQDAKDLTKEWEKQATVSAENVRYLSAQRTLAQQLK